ncbi:MAG: phosphoenolpyruvate synthase/pyruvate phosphate dikinase, partial [Desulfobacterales bacterium]|nr:phosphoenolpyruvate synthase/pyruvate phosphate dikinase [Desulfobacterales bacterium]
MSILLSENQELHEKYSEINIEIPKTLVISTAGFETFVTRNNLGHLAREDLSDEEVTDAFLRAEMPEWLIKELEVYLSKVKYPLSIRSSSVLEDAQFRPYAGLYETYMIPNNHPHLYIRLQHLIKAIKLVYASTFYEGPKAFARSTSSQPQEEAMAVIIQRLTGGEYGEYLYPAIS